MKLIEALKKIPDLQRKADDLKQLVSKHCAITNLDKETYPDQRSKIDGWVQAHGDLLKEILRLRIAIQRTNLETMVPIELSGKMVSKTIAEWIHRRRDLANLERSMWQSLSDRGLPSGTTKSPGGDEVKVEIIRFFDPETRDVKIDDLSSEPSIIDGRLEVVNAVTDLSE